MKSVFEQTGANSPRGTGSFPYTQIPQLFEQPLQWTISHHVQYLWQKTRNLYGLFFKVFNTVFPRLSDTIAGSKTYHIMEFEAD